MKAKYLILLFLLVCNCKPISARENLALHKSYTLSPKPNYELCTDDLDRVQLTDGRTYGSWWVKKPTVGWKLASTGIEIVIDLEQLVPVDQVKVHSVGGGFANVEFPDFIAVLVSSDGRKYGFAGLISSEDLANLHSVGHNRMPHTFVINNLNTEARFVKVVVRPKREFFFLDEIEIIGSKRSSEVAIGRCKNLLKFSDSKELLGAIEDYLHLRENVSKTIEILQNSQNKFSTDLFKKVLSELESLSEKFKLPTDKIYSQSELSALGKKLGTIRAQIYREVYESEFVCSVANPMEMLSEKDMQLVDMSKQQRLDIQLWREEYESAAVNIINCSQEPLDMVVSLSPLVSQDGASVESSKTFTVRRAVFVKALGFGSTADALVLQPDGEPFRLQPGQVSQIWLTAFNPTLTAGNYRGSLAIVASSGQKRLPIKTIGLNLKVENITFPNDVALNTCTWDEYTWFNPVTEHIQSLMVEDLQAHYVNVSAIHPYLIPFLRKASIDKYSRKFHKELQVKSFARMYLLYFEWWSGKKDSGRFGQWMSPAWKREFSAWLRRLVALLKEKGIGYERFALYPFDESLCDEFYQVAKLIKQVDPKIKIYANNFGKGPKDFMRFKDLIDIWSPHWVHCKAHPEWLAAIKGFGKEVWTYGGQAKAPAKTKPPYDYYRLMAWDAFKWGQTGAGFWIYIDRKEHAWDDTLKPAGYYGVIYGAAESPVETHGEKIIPSRRWEAFREGVEDYEYLTQLQKTIDQVRIFDAKAADDAQARLNLQVTRVTSNRLDCGIVYSARQIITETLLQLRQLTHQHTAK